VEGNQMKYALIMSVLAVLLVVGGCANFYEVKEPTSGKVYYTKDLKTIKMGAIRFEDAKTGAAVTLQSSEVRKISEDEFKVRKYTDK
jgi:uncharacterized membrane protein